MMSRAFFICLVYLLFLPFEGVSQSYERQNVLVEKGTFITCTYCPGSALAGESLIELDTNVAVINYHTNDPYTIAESEERIAYYNIESFPQAVFDGDSIVGGGHQYNNIYPVYKAVYDLYDTVRSPYLIAAGAIYNNGNFEVEIEVAKDADHEVTNNRLMVMLTESHIPQEWYALDEVNHVFRGTYPSNEGQEVIDQTNQSFFLSIPVSVEWSLANCEIVVFIQDTVTKEVYQTEKVLVGEQFVGVQSSENEFDVKIYPQPATDILNVEISSSSHDPIPWNLVSMQGKVLRSGQLGAKGGTIPLEGLKDGVYILLTQSKTKQGVLKKRLIINL